MIIDYVVKFFLWKFYKHKKIYDIVSLFKKYFQFTLSISLMKY